MRFSDFAHSQGECRFSEKEYGIGGHTHAVSRESGSYEDHGSKGITLKKRAVQMFR